MHDRLLGTFESERDVAQTRILGVGLDLESQFPANDRIFVENGPQNSGAALAALMIMIRR